MKITRRLGFEINNQKSAISNSQESAARTVTRFSAVTPSRGRFHGRARGASPHLSASFAACLNISTNISRVSLPVAVF
jgi:hypothetical protein